jgi:integrase
MPIVRLKGVKLFWSKGKRYAYYRPTGYRFKADPADEAAFLAEYLKVATPQPVRSKPGEGSFDALIAAYKASPEFKELAPRTRADYAKILDIIGGVWGALAVAGVTRRHVIALRKKFAATPRKANYIVQVVSLLFSWSMDQEEPWREDNPALRVKKYKSGDGYAAWTAKQYRYFIENTKDDELRLAVVMGACTGQRNADCRKALLSDFDGEGIDVVQNKTKKKLWIPAHADLKRALSAAAERRKALKVQSTTVLATKNGRPWSEHWFCESIRSECEALGLNGLTFHGLRKLACVLIYEAGGSDDDIAAITGQSLEMVRYYRQTASQKARAKVAIAKLEQAANEKMSNDGGSAV